VGRPAKASAEDVETLPVSLYGIAGELAWTPGTQVSIAVASAIHVAAPVRVLKKLTELPPVRAIRRIAAIPRFLSSSLHCQCSERKRDLQCRRDVLRLEPAEVDQWGRDKLLGAGWTERYARATACSPRLSAVFRRNQEADPTLLPLRPRFAMGPSRRRRQLRRGHDVHGSTGCTRPSWSGRRDPGGRSTSSSWPPRPGWPGGIPAGSTEPAATSRRPSSRPPTIYANQPSRRR